jgi:hypothetical protein
MHSAGREICHYGRIATEKKRLSPASLRDDGGKGCAESAGADDGDMLHPAHALAPRLP